jgi:hypothetical protein
MAKSIKILPTIRLEFKNIGSGKEAPSFPPATLRESLIAYAWMRETIKDSKKDMNKKF